MCPADQVIPPVGPYLGGMTARISKFDKSWNRTTVASGLASTVDAMGDLQGVSDLQFANGTLYALIAGGGCSHGNATMPSGVVSVNASNGTWRYVGDIGAFMHANPVQYPNVADFEPDGTAYSMVSVNNALHAIEPNSGELLRIDPFSGLISREIDFSASQGHIVPTSVVYKNGSYLVGNLNLFPIEPHTSQVLTVSNFPAGTGTGVPGLNVPGPYYVVAAKAGFATVVGLAIGPTNGQLYVLQLAPDTPSGYPQPGVRKGDADQYRRLADGCGDRVVGADGDDVRTGREAVYLELRRGAGGSGADCDGDGAVEDLIWMKHDSRSDGSGSCFL